VVYIEQKRQKEESKDFTVHPDVRRTPKKGLGLFLGRQVVSGREYKCLKFIGGPFINQTARRSIGLAVIQTRKKVL
jgi:hypothetical protein